MAAAVVSIKPKRSILGGRPAILDYAGYSSPFVVNRHSTRSCSSSSSILSRLSPDEPRSGALILVETLQREGVTDVFTNKDQAISLEALDATGTIHNHVFSCRHSEFSAAKGYAMASGLPGVCMTSGRSYEFYRGMAHAYENNIPLVVMAVDGWDQKTEAGSKKNNSSGTPNGVYGRRLEEKIKCRFHIPSSKDIPEIVREAFFVARSGRPGPVLIDRISHDVLRKLDTPVWDHHREPLMLPSSPSGERRPTDAELEKVVGLLRESKKPLICVGSGCFEWRKELSKLVNLTGIPIFKAVADDIPVYLVDGGLENIYCQKEDDIYVDIESHHRFSLENFDLLLALDIHCSFFFDSIEHSRKVDSTVVRFGEFEEEDISGEEELEGNEKKFQPGGVSSVECGDMKSLIERLTKQLLLDDACSTLDFCNWRKKIKNARSWEYPADTFSKSVDSFLNSIPQVLGDKSFLLADVDPTCYRVRFWDWFCWGSTAYGYSKRSRKKSFNESLLKVDLPHAAGAAIGKRRTGGDEEEEISVIFITEGTSLEKIEELSVLKRENVPVKVVFLDEILNSKNNSRAAEVVTNDPDDDLLSVVESLGIPFQKVTSLDECRDALKVMMKTPGPYVLDIVKPFDPDSTYGLNKQELLERIRQRSHEVQEYEKPYLQKKINYLEKQWEEVKELKNRILELKGEEI